MIMISPIDDAFARWDDLLSLVLQSFAYMEGVVDPPSSALSLTPASLRNKASAERAFVAMEGDSLLGCIFCRPEQPECLYVGKLAVLPDAQGRGIGRALLATAEDAARDLGLPQMRLETRIELVANHATFAAWGFSKTGEKHHKGYSRPTFIEMRKRLD